MHSLPMDIQTVYFISLTILALAGVAVCVFVVLVLKDTREILKRTTSILDNVHNITNTVANPLTMLSGVAAALKYIKKSSKKVKED